MMTKPLPTFRLTRLTTGSHGTFGALQWNGTIHCGTLELPWKANRPTESCVPAGTYRIRRVNSPKFGNVFALMDVDGRTGILIHSANKLSQLLGCIALGEQFAYLDGKPAILASGAAMKEFMDALVGYDEAILTIVESY